VHPEEKKSQGSVYSQSKATIEMASSTSLSRYFVTCQEGPQRIPLNYPVDITLRLQNQAIMAMYLKHVEEFSFLFAVWE